MEQIGTAKGCPKGEHQGWCELTVLVHGLHYAAEAKDGRERLVFVSSDLLPVLLFADFVQGFAINTLGCGGSGFQATHTDFHPAV